MRSMNGFETAKSLGAQKKRWSVRTKCGRKKEGELETLHIRGSGLGLGSLPCVMIHGGTQERRVGALERTE